MSSDNFNVRVLEDSIYLGKNRLENDDDDNNDNDQQYILNNYRDSKKQKSMSIERIVKHKNLKKIDSG